MYKIMIVDDEMLARVGIKSMIDWEQYGFEVIGEAENGKKAFQLASELQPDIIITDIKMPLLNGVELIKRAYEQRIQSKFIVLSAYDDFEYVKEAMQVGAIDYLIKLDLQPENLITILLKVKEIVAAERQDTMNLKIYHEQNIKILRKEFLKKLLMGRGYSSKKILEYIHSYQMVLQEDNILCIIVQPDCFNIYRKYNDDEIHLLEDAMLNVVLEILQNYKIGHAIKTAVREVTILLTFGEMTERSIRSDLKKIKQAIKHALRMYLNISVVLGVSSIQQGYQSIHRCYQEGTMAVQWGFSAPKGSTIYYDDIKTIQSDKVNFIEQVKGLEQALQIDDLEGIKHVFAQINTKVEQLDNVSKKNILTLCHSLLFLAESALYESTSCWIDSLEQEMGHILSLIDFRQWLYRFEDELMNEYVETSRTIRQIKKFIVNNYDKDIRLEVIANTMNISGNYLSSLFKKETDETLIDYVTRVRVNKAIQLLQTTNKKVYEISRLVGYENEYYFSRVFKKITGVSPSRYHM